VRLGTFGEAARKVNLPPAETVTWNELLNERIPDDDELVEIQDDINDTPTALKNAIQFQFASGSASIDKIVPRSFRYYERLIGAFEEGQTLESFANQVVRGHVRALLAWKPFDGYLLGLLLTAQPMLSAIVTEAETNSEELTKITEWAATKGDLMSRMAVLEAGLRSLPQNVNIQDNLSGLVKVFIGEGEEPLTRYRLFSALVMLVYGELARTRALASKPPFWRRLAALAQAALIERCILESGIDFEDFSRWAKGARAELYLLQCYVDLRLEPRWLPALVSARQLRAEFEGRVVNAALAHAEMVRNAGWWQLIDDTEGSLRKRNGIKAVMPGPLEGGLQPQIELPKEVESEIIKDLSECGSIGCFALLSNVALLYALPASLASLAADAIMKADYRVGAEGEDGSLVDALHGLATVSAVTRSIQLADCIFMIMRKSRRFNPGELSIEDCFRIGMVACASHAGLMEWCKAVGDLLSELAFNQLSEEEATLLRSHLIELCHLVPELWSTCGPAEAALRSVLNV
jgi:hypothetical protein